MDLTLLIAHVLNLIWHGRGGDIFIPLSLLDHILSADFLSKISKTFLEVKIYINWVIFRHPAQLIESYKSYPLEAQKISIFHCFPTTCQTGLIMLLLKV